MSRGRRKITRYPKVRKPSGATWPLAFLIVGAAGTTFFATDETMLDRLTHTLPSLGCNIKGNVSINTGERIYHVPGQKYYRQTVIRSEYGERWFCSEIEARAAGWRRSRV